MISPANKLVARPLHDSARANWHLVWQHHDGSLYSACSFTHAHRTELDPEKMCSITDLPDGENTCTRPGCNIFFYWESERRKTDGISLEGLDDDLGSGGESL